jgi:hypothetical protein
MTGREIVTAAIAAIMTAAWLAAFAFLILAI